MSKTYLPAMYPYQVAEGVSAAPGVLLTRESTCCLVCTGELSVTTPWKESVVFWVATHHTTHTTQVYLDYQLVVRGDRGPEDGEFERSGCQGTKVPHGDSYQ